MFLYFVTILDNVEFDADTESSSDFTNQAQNLYMLEAQRIAEKIESYLHEREAEAVYAASIFSYINDTASYREQLLAFQKNKNSSLWLNNGTEINTESIEISTYLYPDIAVTNTSGYEIIHLVNGSDASLRNVSIRANTDFLNESYFDDTKDLSEGEIHVTQLETWYTNRSEIFGNPPLDPDYDEFAIVPGLDFMKTGYIRFCAPIYNNSVFQGIVVLSLDYLHFRELTKHIEPSKTEPVISSRYKGNYVFIFNDEGTIIVHPKPNNIRGRLSDGSLAPNQVKGVTSKTGNYSFNLYTYSSDYREIAQEVLDKKGNHARTTTDVSGREKMTLSVPIIFNVSGYTIKGVFGGVFISVNFETFYDLDTTITDDIDSNINDAYRNAIIFFIIVVVIVAIVVFALIKGMTRPMIKLTNFADKVSRGEKSEIVQSNRTDEIGTLYSSIDRMTEVLQGVQDELELRVKERTSELQKSNVELTQVSKRIESMITIIPEGIILLNEDGTISRYNQAVKNYCFRFLGNAPNIGENVFQLKEHVFTKTIWKLLEVLMKSIFEDALEYKDSEKKSPPFLHTDTIELETDLFLQFSALRSEVGYVVTIKDVSGFLKLERLQKRFISTVSHELRTPITAINLSLDNLLKFREKLSNEQQTTLLSMMKNSGIVLSDMIEDLLITSRIDAKKLKIKCVECEINEILEEIIQQFNIRIKEKELNLNFEVERQTFIHGDRKRISQIFRILIDNAIKYSISGSEIKIQAINDYKGPYNPDNLRGTVVKVSDQGIGISEKDLPNLFKMFFRGSNVGNIGGTGLGLSISKELVERHGGKISVESQLEKGTTFIVFLPKKFYENGDKS